MSDRGIIKELDLGRLGSAGLSNVQTAVPPLHQFMIAHTLDNSANAAVNLGEDIVMTDNLGAGRIVSAQITSPIAVTASDSNYVTITLAKRTLANTAVTIATLNTQTVGSNSITAWVPVSMNLTANAVEYAKGDNLTVKVIATGNGVAIAQTNAKTRMLLLSERI